MGWCFAFSVAARRLYIFVWKHVYVTGPVSPMIVWTHGMKLRPWAMQALSGVQVQPFTPVPDAAVDLPNFDQWINPAIEAPMATPTHIPRVWWARTAKASGSPRVLTSTRWNCVD